MSENCTHDCSTCSESCSSRQEPQSLLESLNELSSVKKVVAIASGKGGVGKSAVTALLAVGLRRRGYKVGIIDADITGPSVPKAFGLNGRANGTPDVIFPVESKTGVRVMSINLLLEDPNEPVVWRGPILAGAVKQFWTDVAWNEVDFMLVDMPPGTGDVPLTVFQSLPVDGLITVTTPQSLVSMVVSKAVKMAGMLDIPMLGIVENMSYFKCPDCGKELYPFGESSIAQLAEEYSLPLLGRLPIDPSIAKSIDSGLVELVPTDELEPALDAIEALLEK